MAAGIEMSECRLWDGVHFMTRRFDRTSNGGKIHMQTLGALAHFDYNMPRQYSYEQAFRVLRAIVNDVRAEEELFRRMVFNVFAWNCDDHVKNISFLMDRDGMWRLSPAYDLTYSYNPGSRWTSGHQMSIAGKNTGIGIYDLMAVSKDVGLKESRARQIIQDVITAVERWSEFAGIAGVDERKMKLIEAKIKQND
jgi:serine/threonine-protein kinase HipA